MSDLEAALGALGLEPFLPKLHELGVHHLCQVGDLLTADLAEAGLSRVQTRQLQRAAAERSAGSSPPKSACQSQRLSLQSDGALERSAIVWDAPAMHHQRQMEPEIEREESEKSESPRSPEVQAFFRLDVGFDDSPLQQSLPEALRKRLDTRKLRSQKLEALGAQGTACAATQLAQPATQRSERSERFELQLGRTRPGEEPDAIPSSARSAYKSPKRRSVNEAASARGYTEAHAKEVSTPRAGRQMFDKNTLRRMQREVFMLALQTFQKTLEVEPPTPRRACGARVQVFVRIRPIFKSDLEKDDFDVVSIPGRGQVMLHSCLFEADLKSPFIMHHTFHFDQVFGQAVTNQTVYRDAAAEIIQSSCSGGVGLLFMFGQTGSGKTHTMCAIEQMASEDIFASLDEDSEPAVSIQFLELRGDKCYDLLANSLGKDFPQLKLREHGNGTYHAEGAMELYPRCPEDMRIVLETAHARRRTSATGANAVSSRSHAVCLIRVGTAGGRTRSTRAGLLVLVDCAGSERRKDSMYHSKERQQESAEINTSLCALKDCCRALASMPRVPPHVLRGSALTKLLAPGLIGGGRLAVICTASPCASDTEHTVATLRLGAALAGCIEKEEKEALEIREQRPTKTHPNQWTPEEVRVWIANLDSGSFVDVLGCLPSDTTGQMLVRFTAKRCAQLCGSSRRGQDFFKLLHEAMQDDAKSQKSSKSLGLAQTAPTN
ncbi:DSK1, partial [Symbiodinium pilosum]